MPGQSGFADLLGRDGVVLDAVVADKPALFALLAAHAERDCGIAASLLLERVRERETLGVTGFGQGAAIPHARIPGLAAVTAVLARLGVGVEYGALDGEPVDVAVLLLSPEGAGADHLKALARISRALRDPASLATIRAAKGDAALRHAVGTADTAKQRAA
jgi:PTS system nitrogen regulatory IIA component